MRVPCNPPRKLNENVCMWFRVVNVLRVILWCNMALPISVSVFVIVDQHLVKLEVEYFIVHFIREYSCENSTTDSFRHCIMKAEGWKSILVQLGLLDCISCISYSWCAWQPHRCGLLKVEEVGSLYTHGHYLLHCNQTKVCQYMVLWIRGICLSIFCCYSHQKKHVVS